MRALLVVVAAIVAVTLAPASDGLAAKRAKTPTAKQCTAKAIKKLKKAKQRKQRRAACAKRRKALAKKKAPARRGAGSAPAGATAKSGAAALTQASGGAAGAAAQATSTTQGAAQFDYLSITGLSEPRFETTTTSLRLPSFDGTEIYLEITRPEAPGRFPVILDSSPYNADPRGLTSDVPERTGGPVEGGLAKYFAPRGYAVVYMDLRGTGFSHGCIDYLGPRDGGDLKHVIDWLGRQAWSNGRVGVTGVSYVGSTPILAAAQRPEALKTIVPIAGWPQVYDSQFQGGVPFLAHWASKTYGVYDVPGVARQPSAAPEQAQEAGCTGDASFAHTREDMLSGRYTPWHAARDSRAKAAANPIPVFAVQGVTDFSVRANSLEWFDRRRNAGDKIMLGNWGHMDPPRGDQWNRALHAWFDRHLAQRDVETGPGAEVFFADGTYDEAFDGARTEILTGPGWPLQTTPVTFRPASDGTLSTAVLAAGTKTFAGSAAGFGTTTDGAIFASPPLTEDLVVAGFPSMRLSASVTAPRVHLIATLYDRNAAGEDRRIGQFAINPELRDGLDKVSLVTPGQRYDLNPVGFPVAHHLKPGHRLVLRVSTADKDKIPMFAEDPNVTVFTGPGATEVTLPAVPASQVARDSVPFKR